LKLFRRKSSNISRKKKRGGLTKNEQEDKKEEEKRLSQEITVLWKDHVDQNLSELHSEIINAKLGRNTSSTQATLNTYVQDFKHFICTTKDEVCR
jgi:hypothetical protein